jgi:hypothetical protein
LQAAAAAEPTAGTEKGRERWKDSRDRSLAHSRFSHSRRELGEGGRERERERERERRRSSSSRAFLLRDKAISDKEEFSSTICCRRRRYGYGMGPYRDEEEKNGRRG